MLCDKSIIVFTQFLICASLLVSILQKSRHVESYKYDEDEAEVARKLKNLTDYLFWDEITHPPEPKKIQKMSKSPVVFHAEPTAVMIFLHDFAEHGYWWQFELEEMQQPYMKIVCPQADRIFVGWKGAKGKRMSSWFDFEGEYHPILMNETRELEQANDYIHWLIDEEIEHGMQPERIILAGIRSGATLALHSALSYPKRLGAVISLSPWLPSGKFFRRTVQDVNKVIPIFQGYVAGDKYVTNETQMKTIRMLKRHIIGEVHFKTYSGDIEGPHQEFADVKQFLGRHVPDIPYFKIRKFYEQTAHH